MLPDIFLQGLTFTGVLEMFHEKGGLRKGEIKNIPLGDYGPERNCLDME